MGCPGPDCISPNSTPDAHETSLQIDTKALLTADPKKEPGAKSFGLLLLAREVHAHLQLLGNTETKLSRDLHDFVVDATRRAIALGREALK